MTMTLTQNPVVATHTQAVSGIVGFAELICVVLSVPALLLYFKAADGRYPAAAAAAAAGPSVSSSSASSSSAAAAATAAAAVQDALQHWSLVAAAVALAYVAALSKEIGITMLGSMFVYEMLLVEVRGRREVGRQLLRLLLLPVAVVGYLYVRRWVSGGMPLPKYVRKVRTGVGGGVGWGGGRREVMGPKHVLKVRGGGNYVPRGK